jgi:hypothetical protein
MVDWCLTADGFRLTEELGDAGLLRRLPCLHVTTPKTSNNHSHTFYHHLRAPLDMH